jgi:hypothetical protein
MHFVHSKYHTLVLTTLAVLFGCTPGTIISETRSIEILDPLPPITILYSGATKFDANNSLLLRIDSTDPEELISICDDSRTMIDTTKVSSTLQWRPGENCDIPLVKYRGKNYILPISPTNISLDILSDISTETLQNTLNITTLNTQDP